MPNVTTSNATTPAQRAFIEDVAKQLYINNCAAHGTGAHHYYSDTYAKAAVQGAETLWQAIELRHPVAIPAPSGPVLPSGPHHVNRGAWLVPDSISAKDPA